MIEITKRFLEDKKINWAATKAFFDTGLVDIENFKDYISSLIDQDLDEKAGVPSEIVEQLIFDKTIVMEPSQESGINKNTKLYKYILPAAIENLVETMKSQQTIDDPLIFREEIFELLKKFDFPENEVEFFLSDIISEKIEEKVIKYLNEYKFNKVTFN